MYLTGQARVMMGAAQLPKDVYGKVAIEALKCATQLDGLKCITIRSLTTTLDIHVFNENPCWSKIYVHREKHGLLRKAKMVKLGTEEKQ